ncbi:MAG: hypothetical protein V1857_01935 [archaeon]
MELFRVAAEESGDATILSAEITARAIDETINKEVISLSMMFTLHRWSILRIEEETP